MFMKFAPVVVNAVQVALHFWSKILEKERKKLLTRRLNYGGTERYGILGFKRYNFFGGNRTTRFLIFLIEVAAKLSQIIMLQKQIYNKNFFGFNKQKTFLNTAVIILKSFFQKWFCLCIKSCQL